MNLKSVLWLLGVLAVGCVPARATPSAPPVTWIPRQATAAGVTVKILKAELAKNGEYHLTLLADSADPDLQILPFWWLDPFSSAPRNAVTLTGADGRPAALSDSLGNSELDGTSAQVEFVAKTVNLSQAQTLTVERVNVLRSISMVEGAPDALLEIPVGAQPDTAWDLDQPVRVGEWSLRLVGARVTRAEPGRMNLELTFTAPPEVYGLTVSCANPARDESLCAGSEGNPYPLDGDRLLTRLFLQDWPDEPLGIQVSGVYARLPGPWTFEAARQP